MTARQVAAIIRKEIKSNPEHWHFSLMSNPTTRSSPAVSKVGTIFRATGTARLRQIPCVGRIRAALLVALIQTSHRFPTKRQLWACSGLALETRTSAEYCYVDGRPQRSKKLLSIRGLNKDHNHHLKGLLKATALTASVRPGPFRDYYDGLLAKGMKPALARLTLARKIAATVLTI